MSDEPEKVNATELWMAELGDMARAALRVLNPHVYYQPSGVYQKQIIPSGQWITVELAVRSWGWEGAERIPDVRNLLERMNLVLQIAREKESL